MSFCFINIFLYFYLIGKMLIKVWFIREVHKKIQIESKYIYWKGVKTNNKIQTNKNIERVQDIQQCSIEYRRSSATIIHTNRVPKFKVKRFVSQILHRCPSLFCPLDDAAHKEQDYIVANDIRRHRSQHTKVTERLKRKDKRTQLQRKRYQTEHLKWRKGPTHKESGTKQKT